MLSSAPHARGFIHKPARSESKPRPEALRLTDLSRALQLLQDPLSGWGTSVLESRSPAVFRFNPNQTHLNELIKV